MNVFDTSKVSIGNFCYGELNVMMWQNPSQRLEIGNCVSIAPNVTFILGGNHHLDRISTYPFFAELIDFDLNAGESGDVELTRGPITIRDDVWIGTQATVLSGVTVNQGAVIGARAVVTRDVPAYAICAGNPGKVIGYRFDPEIIEKLVEHADYSKLDMVKIRENMQLLNSKLTDRNLSQILAIFD